ncbi:flagellar biosynthetic protein FliQ [Geothermobacter hydrogeniphilus]|uniref:Flagellar biosynthetic protein FliQ n=1 Tax=Geothermobacter hydrogeniphilus TaxID=1969733 RepID=A0A2K2HCW4_9BACT|nr:flagellar biosynthesis protein FliQ [Geothermobacter hydrogeniphilus]PNU21132.1 flagellar biosynthetic protein FliQ [Geothermobacter hydrogeniphilus]
MSPEMVIDVGRRAVELVLLLSAPMLICAVVVGLVISVLQAATQINEQTMTFIPKIVAVLVALVLFAPWMIKLMLTFTREIYSNINHLGG